jgi:transposase
MSLKFKSHIRVFVFSEIVDLRAGFDRLTSIVETRLKQKLIDGDLFLFMGRSRTKLKMICYDGTGVVLINKRIERGKFMSLYDLEHREITTDELDQLLRGSIVRRPVFGNLRASCLTDLPVGLNHQM